MKILLSLVFAVLSHNALAADGCIVLATDYGISEVNGLVDKSLSDKGYLVTRDFDKYWNSHTYDYYFLQRESIGMSRWTNYATTEVLFLNRNSDVITQHDAKSKHFYLGRGNQQEDIARELNVVTQVLAEIPACNAASEN